MIKRLFLFMVAAVMAIAASDANAQEDSFNAEDVKRLRGELKTAATPMDSVKILYNIMDLTRLSDKPGIIKEIYPIAVRMNNDELRLDLCRQAAVMLNDPQKISKVMDEVKKISPSDQQKETEALLKMRRLSINSRKMSEEQRQREIAKIINHFENTKHDDSYEQILELFALVEYLRDDSQGDMLTGYVNKLGDLAYKSGFKLDAIPNLIFSEIAVIYSDTENYKKAVDADRHLLEIIADLEKKYAAMGRIYRKYNINKYISYRRMLRNYPALAPGEAQQYYEECKRLSELGPTLKDDFTTSSLVHAPYYMAIGDYKTAIPYLKDLLEEDSSLVSQRQNLKRLIEASEKAGDKETLLYALSKYNDILVKYNEKKSNERYKELQIKYDVKQLNERNAELELEGHKAEIESARRMMTFVSVAFIIILIVLVMMLFNWGKSKKLDHTLKTFAGNLNEERNRIRRNVYFEGSSAPDPLAIREAEEAFEKRLNKERKKSMESAMKFMTETVMNDLLHIAMAGNAERLRFVHEVSIDSLLREAYDKTPEADKSTKIKIDYPDHDRTLVADRGCLTDFFAHIFSTMIRNSSENAWIKLEYTGEMNHRALFTFTLSEKVFGMHDEPRLFDMLLNFDDMISRKQDGMYVCRMITMLIYCTLRLAEDREGCYKYVFSVPVDLNRPES